MAFPFEIKATEGKARTGVLKTPRGDIRTPAFMPVGTAATVKAVTTDQLRSSGVDVVLANTYHLMLRPSAERIARLGGLHGFMRWDRPILTDSGGFQVMSLAKLRQITDAGVAFQSHIDGGSHLLTPERAIEVQCLLGADIQMQLDECIELPAEHKEAERAMQLSLCWAERALNAFATRAGPGQALFGIVQGGIDAGLRRRSAEALVGMDFPGYAVGGLAVGEGQELMLTTLEGVLPILPAAKPRYLMGVGSPSDLILSVARGVDMFDCVLPTRNGRHGLAFTRFGAINLRNARHAADPRPLDETSPCEAARSYSRAYLHHLVRVNEMLGAMLLSEINLAYYQELMQGIRAAIGAGTFAVFKAATREAWERGDIPAFNA